MGGISRHVDMCLNTQVLNQMEDKKECTVCGSVGVGGMNSHIECCKEMKRQKMMELDIGQETVEDQPKAFMSSSGVPNQAASVDADDDDEAPAIIG